MFVLFPPKEPCKIQGFGIIKVYPFVLEFVPSFLLLRLFFQIGPEVNLIRFVAINIAKNT